MTTPVHPAPSSVPFPRRLGVLALAMGISLPALAAPPDPCSPRLPADRPWARFRHAWNPLSRYRALEALAERYACSDIPAFISLLQCFNKIGRESDTVAEFAFDHLKSVIPLEFEPSRNTVFESDPAERNRIIALYQAWWGLHAGDLEYDPAARMFFPKTLDPEARKQACSIHSRWYVRSQGTPGPAPAPPREAGPQSGQGPERGITNG